MTETPATDTTIFRLTMKLEPCRSEPVAILEVPVGGPTPFFLVRFDMSKTEQGEETVEARLDATGFASPAQVAQVLEEIVTTMRNTPNTELTPDGVIAHEAGDLT